MRSCIYEGQVVHVRHKPRFHKLRYRVFSLLLDLNELEAIGRRFRFLSVNKPGILSFRERDHGNGDTGTLRYWVEEHLGKAGISRASELQILLLCYPRIWGYVFNPLSVYYCLDHNNQLVATLYEVRNTFGEKHTYVIAGGKKHGPDWHQKAGKKMRVSPFTNLSGNYHFDLSLPSEKLHLSIQYLEENEPVLLASFHGARRPLSDRFVLFQLIKYPLMTVKVIAGIHIEAFRLWLKNVPLVLHNPDHAVEPRPIPAPFSTHSYEYAEDVSEEHSP